MHSDTSTLASETSDLSIISNTTYEVVSRKSDEDSDGKKESESDVVSEEKKCVTDKDGMDTASLSTSVGSMWSDGPSVTDSPKSFTVTVSSCTAASTDTGYTSKEVQKVSKKIEKKWDRNNMKKNVMKRKERRKLGVVSGIEADESDRAYADEDRDGDGESCL